MAKTSPASATPHTPERRRGQLDVLERRITDELTGRMISDIPREEISHEVGRALHELQDSIALDSIAEAARQLARHRLDTATLPDSEIIQLPSAAHATKSVNVTRGE